MGRGKLNSENNKGICGLILTAGYSSRMGSFKPLLQIDDRAAIERIIDTLRETNLENIVAVTGYKRELLQPVLERKGIASTYNRDFSEGMFTSIKAGIKWALSELFMDSCQEVKQQDMKVNSTMGGFLLMLVDCPSVPSEIIQLILEKHVEEPDAFIVPCYRGKKGHPLFIPAIYSDEILAYQGEGGLKGIINGYEDKLIKLEVDCEAVVLDMDTPEGYQEILEYYEEQLLTDRLENVKSQWKDRLNGRRLFLIRHGEIEQHSEKIFLGQTDVPLSDRGREQARMAGLELKKYSVKANQIYTSDLCRATETAEIIANILDETNHNIADKMEYTRINLVFDIRLREMALGEWDGHFIRKIKEQYPEEYKKRGQNLLSYKFGNHSENFYDLQYRVMKVLENILKLENQEMKFTEKNMDGELQKDVIIIAHAGVIKVILSNLYGTDLCKEIEKPLPNGGITLVDFTSKNTK